MKQYNLFFTIFLKALSRCSNTNPSKNMLLYPIKLLWAYIRFVQFVLVSLPLLLSTNNIFLFTLPYTTWKRLWLLKYFILHNSLAYPTELQSSHVVTLLLTNTEVVKLWSTKRWNTKEPVPIHLFALSGFTIKSNHKPSWL